MVLVHRNRSALATCPVRGVKLWFPLAAGNRSQFKQCNDSANLISSKIKTK